MAGAKPTTRADRGRNLFGWTIGVSLLTGGVLGAAAMIGARPIGLVVAGVAMAGLCLGMWLSWRWWRTVDEAVREAHKTGWFWGGSGGMAVAAVFFAALQFVGPEVQLDRFALIPGDAGLILTGIVLTMVLQIVGYGLVWAGWWLVRGR
jgi:hypothetical protein